MAARRPSTAHVAIGAAFVALGAIDGTWAARLPAFKHRLHLDSGRLGLVIFSVSAAATLLLPVAGWRRGIGNTRRCSSCSNTPMTPSF